MLHGMNALPEIVPPDRLHVIGEHKHGFVNKRFSMNVEKGGKRSIGLHNRAFEASDAQRSLLRYQCVEDTDWVERGVCALLFCVVFPTPKEYWPRPRCR